MYCKMKLKIQVAFILNYSDDTKSLKGLLLVFAINKQDDLNYLLINKKLFSKDSNFVKILVGTKCDLKEEREVDKSYAIEKAAFDFD